MVSVLTMGTMTFGGTGQFAKVGATDAEAARRQVDMCLDAGRQPDRHRRRLLGRPRRRRSSARRCGAAATTSWSPPRCACRWEPGPNDAGPVPPPHRSPAARPACAGCGTDHIDLYQVHEWDGADPARGDPGGARPAGALRQGPLRRASSNFAGWQLMKALGHRASEHGLPRFVSQQIYYSLQAREAEYELIPLAIDQGLGVLVWSPLAGGLLSGKYRRGEHAPGRLAAPHRLGRAAGLRRGRAVRHDRGARRDRRRSTASPPPRSRSPTSSAGRRSPPWSSARAPTTIWPTTWRPPS